MTSSSRPSPCHFNTIRTLQLYSELNCTRAGQVQGKKVTTGRPSRRRSSGIEAQPERPTLPLQGEAQPGRWTQVIPRDHWSLRADAIVGGTPQSLKANMPS